MNRNRILTSDDAREYYELRLTALTEHPEAFGSSAEDFRKRTVDDVASSIGPVEVPPQRFTLGAYRESRLIGTMTMYREGYPKLRHKGHVVGVYVAESWRRRGVAGGLLDDLIARATAIEGLEQLHLLAVTTNLGAIRLYRSRGFETFGIETRAMKVDNRYYDEAHMQLLLPTATPKAG